MCNNTPIPSHFCPFITLVVKRLSLLGWLSRQYTLKNLLAFNSLPCFGKLNVLFAVRFFFFLFSGDEMEEPINTTNPTDMEVDPQKEPKKEVIVRMHHFFSLLNWGRHSKCPYLNNFQSMFKFQLTPCHPYNLQGSKVALLRFQVPANPLPL